MLDKTEIITQFRNGIINDRRDIVKQTLETKMVDINMDDGWALKKAIYQSNIPMVSLLLLFKADTNYIYQDCANSNEMASVSSILSKAKISNMV